MHTTGNNQILSARVFLRESRGGGAIANKEEEEPYEFEEAVAITAMATAIRLVFWENNNG